MPHPIPEEKVLSAALKYLSYRQLEHRPTTLEEFNGRMGLGADRLMGRFEKENIRYILICHDTKKQPRNRLIEILLVSIPNNIAEWLGISNELLYSSYEKMSKKADLTEVRPVEYWKVTEDTPGDALSAEEIADPYVHYRISREQFEEMKKDLIDWKELLHAAKEKGYSHNAIRRAIGGHQMRFVLAGPMWRPYVYQRTRYYLKEVLKHLEESDKSYKYPMTAQRKRRRRQREMDEIKNPLLFRSRKELMGAQMPEDLKDYSIR